MLRRSGEKFMLAVRTNHILVSHWLGSRHLFTFTLYNRMYVPIAIFSS